MGHGFDLAVVHAQGGLEKLLAVAGDAGAGEERTLGDRAVHATDDLDGRGDRVALVARVVAEHDLALGVHHDGLDRRGTGVDAEEQRTGGGRHRPLWDGRGCMPGEEVGALGFVGEQRTHPVGDERDEHFRGEPGQQFVGRAFRPFGEQGGADGDVELGVRRGREGIDLVGQGALVGPAQFGRKWRGPPRKIRLPRIGCPQASPAMVWVATAWNTEAARSV